MRTPLYSVITGTGSYIPEKVVANADFAAAAFYDDQGQVLTKPSAEIVAKFEQITDIRARRYVTDDLVTSDLAYFAALETLRSSGTDPETLDYLIVAHNFGDVRADNRRSEFVPSLAARVKQRLGIANPYAVAYDLPFGCPGWVQGLIQADYFLKSGDARKALVIGAEVLSRVADPHDRDTMLYADGAGAVLLEARASAAPIGMLAHRTRSDTDQFAQLLRMGTSYNPLYTERHLFLKMNGRKLYEYALRTVPQAIKDCLEKAEIPIQAVKKVLIHQANGKMDDAIIKRFYSLYGIAQVPADVMPMTISWLGNSSVATLPTLLDLILQNQFKGQQIHPGDAVVFASVGAGMNINAVAYQF